MSAQSHLLTLVTFLPMLGVLALLFLKSDDHVWIRRIALAASVAEFVISLFLLRGFNSADPNFQLQELHDWIGRGIHYHLGIDGISLFLVILTTFLTPLAILCSWQSIQKNVKGFFISLLVIETAMIGVFVSLDLFLFFVFWELTLIPMYFIIGIWGHDRRIYAAVKFILYTMFGSILMLVAILWLYNLSPGTRGMAPTFDFPEILARMAAGYIPLGGTTEMLLFAAFFLAFAIKVPLFPLHTWLPDAHTEAPTAGSVILAGVMLKLGTYGILRFCVPLFPHAVLACRSDRGNAGDHRHRLWRAGCHRAARFEAARRLHIREPPRIRRAGDLCPEHDFHSGRGLSDAEPRQSPPARSSLPWACSTTAATRTRSSSSAASPRPCPC